MIKRIPVSALKVGMYITDLNNDWIPHNIQRRRGVIKKEETLDKVRKLGVDYVYIDVSKGLDSQDSEPGHEVDRRNEEALERAGGLKPGSFRLVPVQEEMVAAQKVHHSRILFSVTLMRSAVSDVSVKRTTICLSIPSTSAY